MIHQLTNKRLLLNYDYKLECKFYYFYYLRNVNCYLVLVYLYVLFGLLDTDLSVK